MYSRKNHAAAIEAANQYAESIDGLRTKALTAARIGLLKRDPGHAHVARVLTVERERAALDVQRAIFQG